MGKVITLSDEAYEALKKIKSNKSFSEIVIEITKEKNKDELMSLAGSITNEDAEKIKKAIYEGRKIKSRRFS
jgi:predicted CopG family antitoxin